MYGEAMDDERRLSTRETAERLGVKPETVYAYVSRGQLSSRREPGGRGSTFDADEVDALVGKGRREPQPGGDIMPRIRTGITLIDSDRYYYRGVEATGLAARFSYEEIADWLWTGTLRPGVRFEAPAEALRRCPSVGGCAADAQRFAGPAQGGSHRGGGNRSPALRPVP